MTYRVILADPPWEFKTRSAKGEGRSAKQHYPTMPLKEICDLPVGDLANKNCALFLWAVWPSQFDAVPAVLKAWGFRYATLAWVWVKLNKNSMGLKMSNGYYSRHNAEPCYLAVRGRMPVAAHDVLDVIMAPVMEHSRKPDEQYQKIERLYPGGPYVEVFGRRKRSGWHVWGNEVVSDVELLPASPERHRANDTA